MSGTAYRLAVHLSGGVQNRGSCIACLMIHNTYWNYTVVSGGVNKAPGKLPLGDIPGASCLAISWNQNFPVMVLLVGGLAEHVETSHC